MQRQITWIMLKRILLSSCLAVFALSVTAKESVTDSLLHVLENEIEQYTLYTARKQARIDSLRAIRPMTDEIRLRIAKEYQHFQSDSSRAWYVRLQEVEEPVRSQAFIGVVKLLSSTGHFSNAIALLQNDQGLSIRSSEGYKTAWLLYSEAAANTQIPMLQEQEAETARRYHDSMMIALEREAPFSVESALWLASYRAQDKNDWKEAIYYNEQLLALSTPYDHLYAILAYGNAMLYEQAGDKEKRLEWLIRSAITDVRCGITDNGSSWIVAQECFDAGELNRAYTLSEYSLNNATFFNAPTRFIQNFKPGHLIVSRYDHELQQYSTRMRMSNMVIIAALIITLLLCFVSWWQTRRLKALNKKVSSINVQLKASNDVKEQYICRYLEVYSDYIRRLTTMARKAGEKDSAAFMDREMENFYRSFDDTFLSLYGTFVQDFNALLKPEARITPKPGERMTVEMRIFALILLGINSSAKIAELLCYSPNTISNYRVKMKNSALGNRDTFEDRVKQIKVRIES